MEILIDTHLLLWYLLEPSRLKTASQERLQDTQQTVLVSMASVWEASIKSRIGKLHLPGNLVEGIRQVGFTFLNITAHDAWDAGQLPLHHRDPFDRLIIAQALRRTLPVMTQDDKFSLYGVDVMSP